MESQNYQEIRIPPLGECVGVFEGLEITNSHLAILLSHKKKSKVVFPIDSIQAKIVKKELNDQQIGRKIGIIRIDDVEQPVVIRKFPLEE